MQRNGVLKTVGLTGAAALAGGYIIMCLYWLFTGCKYGAMVCLDFFLKTSCLIFIAGGAANIISASLSIAKIRRLDRLYEKLGASDSYYEQLRMTLSGRKGISDEGLLSLASAYLSGERYEECYRTLEEISFEKLTAAGQSNYFNILLYGKLMEGDVRTANGIYRSSRHYFDRALTMKRHGHILHTLGVLEYANGRYARAEGYFNSAKGESGGDISLRCDCDLYLGLCYLKTDRKEYARQAAICAAGETDDPRQEINLKKLMRLVENAYKEKGETT